MIVVSALHGQDGGPTFSSCDPRDGRFIAEFPVHSPADVQEVVTEARMASLWWQGIGTAARNERLRQWRKLLFARFAELTSLISAETGKPLDDAKIELVLALDHLHWAQKNSMRVLRRRRVKPGMLMFNHSATVEYQPLGIVGVIGPWNYPVFTPMGAIGYALAAGNSVVFKPSEFTPATGKWLRDTFREIVPEQPVLEIVTGYGETGAALCGSEVDKIAFIGSTATGKRVMAACSESLTPVIIECGGKDALLVDWDADLAQAADATVWGALSNAGQTCVGVERVYVVESVADRFIDLVKGKAGSLRVGSGPHDEIGPVTVPAQLDIIGKHVRCGIESGATVVMGGLDSVRPPYIDPVVLVDVDEKSDVVTEETFGPVIIINRVATIDEAVNRANDTRYGLGATLFSKRRGRELAPRLRAGMVGVNSIVPFVAIPSLPFGGRGDSGFGRIHGDDGLREFSRAQSVARKIAPAILRPTSFSRPSWTVKALSLLARLLYGR